MALDARAACDRYWAERMTGPRAARSRERALAAVGLLRGAGVGSGRLLDAGCGPGWALEAFRAAGFDALGIDASAAAVREARSRGLEALVADLERDPLEGLPGAAGGFDAVVALEVLEHLTDPLAALRRLAALARPGGGIAVSLPNELALPARLKVLLGRLPFGGHDDPHLRHFDRPRARALFRDAGLEVRAERVLSVVPPRWPVARALARPAAAALPGLFSIAAVYLLAPCGEGGLP
ncbi:MAG: methyltransferase domain-containing protein [Planctomycetes bacterium]|nr:methyltransferase domain-containing protein [Planctomycetota bacterium]